MVVITSNLSDLLITSKDGDWGKDVPQEGFLPYRVIRGGDFPDVRLGDTSKVPLCYLNKKTVNKRTLQEKDIIIETAGGTKDRPTGRTILIKKRIIESFDFPVTCASFARFLRIDPRKAVPEYIYWYLQYLYESGEMWQHQVQHTGIARFHTLFLQNQLKFHCLLRTSNTSSPALLAVWTTK
jgi:type I restriction enzyme, S subunit